MENEDKTLENEDSGKRRFWKMKTMENEDSEKWRPVKTKTLVNEDLAF